MRKEVLRFLVCPRCQKTLKLHTETQDDNHIMEGQLQCVGCSAAYPISRGIPILLEEREIDKKNKVTAERFGHEWEQFDFIDTERYAQQFLEWIAPVQSDFFREKVVLDAGCGKGRHCIAATQFQAKEILGIDLASGSVRAAFRNTRHLPNVHIIQANIYHLPFRHHTFDYVYSVGVLHHTPDPKSAFACLVNTVKPGGRISAWVYGKEGNWWIIYILNPLRTHITSKLPFFLLKAISFILSVILKIIITTLYIPINRYRTLQPLSRFLFYNDYLYHISSFPLKEKYCIVFDHLHPELAFYISQEEFTAWFEENHLNDVLISRKTNNSWRGTGNKP